MCSVLESFEFKTESESENGDLMLTIYLVTPNSQNTLPKWQYAKVVGSPFLETFTS